MEASAGLVAGSHNRNELVVIHGHEEVIFCFLCVFMEQLVRLTVLLCGFGAAQGFEELGWASV